MCPSNTSAAQPWTRTPVIQKLSRADRILGTDTWRQRRSSVGRNKRTLQPQNKSELEPLYAHSMCVHQSTPSSNCTSNARALGEQNPGSCSAPFLSLSWVPYVGHIVHNHTLQRWGNLTNEKSISIGACCFTFGLFKNEAGFIKGSWGRQASIILAKPVTFSGKDIGLLLKQRLNIKKRRCSLIWLKKWLVLKQLKIRNVLSRN